MSRPEHLHCPNTAEGIRRINEEQERYDRDPQQYEQRDLETQGLREEEWQRQAQEQQWMTEILEYERFTNKLDGVLRDLSELPDIT